MAKSFGFLNRRQIMINNINSLLIPVIIVLIVLIAIIYKLSK